MVLSIPFSLHQRMIPQSQTVFLLRSSRKGWEIVAREGDQIGLPSP